MPKCNACGRNYDDPNNLELIRNEGNRWVSVCRDCLGKGVDINLVDPTHIAVDAEALATANSPAINVTPTGNPLDDAKKVLAALRELRQSSEHIGRARSHERKQIELQAHFTLARDDTRHQGVVRDYSQGGLRIGTNLHLTRGQIVQFDWNIPLPPAMARVLQNTAEVRRVTKDEGGMYDVGLKFLARQLDRGANRRRFRRYKCDMLAYYQRNGSEIMSSAKVTDISQGGCQMKVDEELQQSEVFSVRIIGGGGARGDLVGTMRVCRVSRKEVVYETGCAFGQMRMEKQ